MFSDFLVGVVGRRRLPFALRFFIQARRISTSFGDYMLDFLGLARLTFPSGELPYARPRRLIFPRLVEVIAGVQNPLALQSLANSRTVLLRGHFPPAPN
jgi:hypothetical protein